MDRLQTVVELDVFLRRARAIMSDDERMEIVDYVAANPEAGIALGGLRDRAAQERRVSDALCLRCATMPLFLVTVFSRNEKANLSRTELAAAVELRKALVAHYGERG